jgi:signal transduction histidine kinase
MAPRWYRSLYWRIAIGFVLCLAAILLAQAVLFVWAASRSGPALPGQPPDRFAGNVALDLSAALERDPELDLAAYIQDQYESAYPFLLVLPDGGRVGNGDAPFPAALIRQAQLRLEQLRARVSERPRFGPEPRPGAGRRGPDFRRRAPGDPFNPGAPGGGLGANRLALVTVRGQPVGLVLVLPRAPFGFLLRRYAPTLGLVAGGTLVLGAILTAVLIFGPARRRLREVEEAARRLGSGDLTARAPDQGGDEVAAVASAFNAMASDLSARAEALAAADRGRRQLLADVSHELTTPVTAMRGYLETLAMPDFPVDDRTRARYLGIIGDETSRLERIIGELLELARLEGGGGGLNVSDVSVKQLMERVVERHEPVCLEAGLTIASAIEPGAEWVRGDRDRLEQALQNLAANALRYAPTGSAVQLGARLGGDRSVILTVSDEGPGIPPEHLEHLFDRFYKVEPSRSPHSQTQPGSGLGLSIVKAIVERHGGTLSVSSQPGRTTFTVTLLRPGGGNGERAARAASGL